MAGTRTRKDVWKLADWDPILLWYAKAIAEMQKRPIEDPTSWRYQAAIHDYIREEDPISDESDVLPSGADQERFWMQCQHSSWFFLPWHRMYLLFFEQIISDAIVKLGGPSDWALPYWNYSDTNNPKTRQLPPTFQAAKMPNGSPNPLRVEQRRQGANSGQVIASDAHVNIQPALIEPLFSAETAIGGQGFGGPQTVFNHAEGPIGVLEGTPHGTMHVRVGGDFGWMSSFNTAALDPLFWLHHANIDRLWSVWLRRDASHANPQNAAWLSNITFEFHDASAAVVSMTASKVVDTTVAPLLYGYEDTSDPLGAAGPIVESLMGRMEEPRIPEMVGATAKPITLKGGVTTATLSLTPPTGPARVATESPGVPVRIHLNLENIKGTGPAVSHIAYLNVPSGDDPASHDELRVGVLPMFGLKEASRSSARHSGSGLHYAFDVSSIVERLKARNDWDPNNVRITLVPERDLTEAPASTTPPITVGRISVYYT